MLSWLPTSFNKYKNEASDQSVGLQRNKMEMRQANNSLVHGICHRSTSLDEDEDDDQTNLYWTDKC
jgi:hypothetical protein